MDITNFAPLQGDEDGIKACLVVATDCANMASWVNGTWQPAELQRRVDGGVSAAGGAGCGWLLWGCHGGAALEWTRLATGSWPLPAHITAVDAELMGLISALRFLHIAMRSGVLRKCDRPGAIDTDYLKATARPQLWAGLARKHAQVQGSAVRTQSRRTQPDAEVTRRLAKQGRQTGVTTMTR